MSRSPTSRPTITLIGAGNLAQALGPALKTAGYMIDFIVARETASSRRRAAMLARLLDARTQPLNDAGPASDIIWICHTDDALAETAKLLARKPGWAGKIVLHSSGALSSDVLLPLKRKGASTASLHPMMTFVPGATPRMEEVPFAVEGDSRAVSVARKIVRDLGAESFPIKKAAKPLYHALGSFSSPMIVAALVTAERVGRGAGLTASQTRRVMAPILHQTVKNYAERGAAAAFSGPIKRGDLNTVLRHLKELKSIPGASEVYRALVKSALMDLPTKNATGIRRLLDEL
jgi:predicted short-subunit dehydrogenase-like oxidoreductase (DUF2520 family)